MAIDARLLDCDSPAEVEENFDRILAITDELAENAGSDEANISALQTTVGALKVCTIAFDSDGGSAVSAQYMLNGAMVTEPATPTKTGKVFNGWYSGEAAWDFTAAVTDSMTLTAHWADEEPTP